jgi:NADH dehydrogenase (ubiquinone) Fe-S protein 3
MNKQLGIFLSKSLPHFIQKFSFKQKELHIELTSFNFLTNVLSFLKNNSLCQYKILIDITAVDFLSNANRFEVIYNLLSTRYNSRIFIKIDLNNFFQVDSICTLFSCANWLEREVWDMYGIFFYGHSDLRRILNNYGFNGYSLRKDFSLNGYVSFRYDDLNKLILSEPLELSQFNLDFNYQRSPWR